MKMLVQAGQYRGSSKQPLKNVLVYAPTIIWVDKGHKQLWWHDASHRYTSVDWLVIPASHYLTFVNEPAQTLFHSRTLTFLEAPPAEWIEASANKSNSAHKSYSSQKNNVLNRTKSEEPRVAVTPQLAYCFDILFSMAEKKLAHETQKNFLFGFYAELKHIGALHLLFPGSSQPIRERLAHYLSVSPGDHHKIETVARHLLMSRATLVRKLAAEDTSFRQILTNVRMVYALSLMQDPHNQLTVALACGYQSESRFSSRFKQEFGLTPRQYLHTL